VHTNAADEQANEDVTDSVRSYLVENQVCEAEHDDYEGQRNHLVHHLEFLDKRVFKGLEFEKVRS